MAEKKRVRESPVQYRVTKPVTNGKRPARLSEATRVKYPPAKSLGKFIVADPRICHGTPTYRGTRIMAWQVLEMLSEGMTWEMISEQWRGRVSQEAIAETLELAAKNLKRAYKHIPQSSPL